MTKRTNNPHGAPVRLTNAKRRSLFVAQPDWDDMQQRGSGNVSEGLRIALAKLKQLEKPG